MSRTVRILLEEILESAQRILAYTSGLTFDQFEADVEKQDAVIRRIEIIGEAAKGLPADFRATHDGVPWRSIAGTRDILIHEYFRVDLALTWDAIKTDLPTLIDDVRKIIDALEH